MKYTTDGKNEVKAGRIVIAKSFVGSDGYEVRLLQGVPKNEVWDKIFEDCPDFAEANDMKRNYSPKLFA